MRVHYEWDMVELEDSPFEVEDPDIRDHSFTEKLRTFIYTHEDILANPTYQLSLVRDEVQDDYNVTDRAWARTLLIDGQLVLCKFFDNGKLVPHRFHNELCIYAGNCKPKGVMTE